ncbi:unnamed protein product [Triticum turgidum subsp. durum]|uniref:Tify domain-containing protein n=1 Tax=Triticum turgidum subsp. durum TaxID=4567 RepID=A0A9R1RMZ9_TRITD|nr:unnamed protein product [Triticum turgidum subsp. durum]
MSSRAPPVELDFLGLRAAAPSEQHGKSTGSSSLSSIRGMETSAIARIDPQLLRRVVVARSPATTEEAPAAPSPMTVFYNGSVAIFDVSHHKVIISLRACGFICLLLFSSLDSQLRPSLINFDHKVMPDFFN